MVDDGVDFNYSGFIVLLFLVSLNSGVRLFVHRSTDLTGLFYSYESNCQRNPNEKYAMAIGDIANLITTVCKLENEIILCDVGFTM